MKALTTNGLTKLIQLIKSSFISNTDTVTTNTVTLANVATTGDYDDLINKPDVSSFVTKTGNETIGGNKSFTGSTTFNESTFEGDVTFTGGTITDFTGVYVSLGGGATADTPSTSDNSYAVATTEFVKNQGYVTSSAIQTQLDGKADTDLSNLTATSSTNFDGQWIALYQEAIGSTAQTINAGAIKNIQFSNLPAKICEVLFTISQSTNYDLGIYSDLISGTTNRALKQGCISMILPVSSNKTIKVQNLGGGAASINLVRMCGYRVLGTNTNT